MIYPISQLGPSIVRDITLSIAKDQIQSRIPVLRVSSVGTPPKESNNGENVSAKKKRTASVRRQVEEGPVYTKSLKTTSTTKKTIVVI